MTISPLTPRKKERLVVFFTGALGGSEKELFKVARVMGWK